MSNQLDEFVNLLRTTISPDNSLRKAAESSLDDISAEVKIGMLLEVLVKVNDLQVIEVASLLLRQNLNKLTSCDQINASILTTLKNNLPQLCLQQASDSARHKIIDALNSLIIIHCIDGKVTWPECLSFVYNCLWTSNNHISKDVGLRILEGCPFLLESLTIDMARNIFSVFNATLSNFKSNPSSLVQSVIATYSSIMIEIPYKKIQSIAHQTFPFLLNILTQSDDESILVDIITELSVIIECRTKSVRPIGSELLHTMLYLLNSDKTQKSVRLEAMECIATYCEYARKTFTSSPLSHLLVNIVQLLIKHIASIPDDQSWYSKLDDSDDDEMELSVCGETCLDRITCSIGGKIMLPIIMECVPSLLRSQVWQYRCAALITIGCIAEGCRKPLKFHLPTIVETVVPFIKDPVPRVAYYTINCLGQLAVDYCGHFHSSFHQQVFPAIFYASEAFMDYPKVRAHGICCFNNLLGGCPRSVLDLYSDEFFARLRSLLLSTMADFNKVESPFVLEHILSSLSKFAETRDADFAKYYPNIIQEVITLVRSFLPSVHGKLFVSAVETLSSILNAVPSEVCQNELPVVVELLRALEINLLKTDDSENLKLEYIEIATSLADVLGDSFIIIAERMIPYLVNLASVPVDDSVLTSITDMKSDKKDQSKVYSAHTEVINERQRICSIIEKILETSPSCVVRYIDELSKGMICLLKETCDGELHEIILRIFSMMLKIAFEVNKNSAFLLWMQVFEMIFNKIHGNPFSFNNDILFDGLRSSIKVVSHNGLTNEILLKLVDLINEEFVRIGLVVKTSCSQASEEESIKDEDDDYSDMDDDDDSDISVLDSIVKLNRTLFKLLKSSYFSYFMKTLDNLVTLSSYNDQSVKCLALSMFTDVIRLTPDESVQLASNIFALLTPSLSDQNVAYRRTGFYCVGIMAQYAAKQYQNYISSAIPAIVAAIKDENSRTELNASATANGIAAIGRIMKYSPNLITPFDTALTTWLSWLPACDDEVNFNLAYLVEIIETYFLPNIGNLHQLSVDNINIFYKSLDSIAAMIPYVNDEVSNLVVALVSKVKTHVPEPFNKWYQGLDSSLRKNMEYAFPNT